MVSLIFEKWTSTFPHISTLNDEIWVGFGWALYVVTKDQILFQFVFSYF